MAKCDHTSKTNPMHAWGLEYVHDSRLLLFDSKGHTQHDSYTNCCCGIETLTQSLKVTCRYSTNRDTPSPHTVTTTALLL